MKSRKQNISQKLQKIPSGDSHQTRKRRTDKNFKILNNKVMKISEDGKILHDHG